VIAREERTVSELSRRRSVILNEVKDLAAAIGAVAAVFSAASRRIRETARRKKTRRNRERSSQ